MHSSDSIDGLMFFRIDLTRRAKQEYDAIMPACGMSDLSARLAGGVRAQALDLLSQMPTTIRFVSFTSVRAVFSDSILALFSIALLATA
ncbi:hypothetical protein RAD15_15080 [Bradyrhizobium sp. 14AA]